MADKPIEHHDLEKELKSPLQFVDNEEEIYDKMWVDMADALRPIQRKWMGRPNNARNLEEFEKEAVDACLKVGLIVRVHTAEVLLGISRSPIIEPIGRISFEHEGGYDHEKHRQEVLRSKQLGENKAGMKERNQL